jgi:hypothetical protein
VGSAGPLGGDLARSTPKCRECGLINVHGLPQSTLGSVCQELRRGQGCFLGRYNSIYSFKSLALDKCLSDSKYFYCMLIIKNLNRGKGKAEE